MTSTQDINISSAGNHDLDVKDANMKEHEENVDSVDVGHAQAVSQYVGLSKIATVRRFWLVCFFCVLAAFGKKQGVAFTGPPLTLCSCNF